jgi:anthranilate synthase component 2
VVEEEGMPDCLEVTARDADGRVMALRHRTFDVQGVQFHPESILTPDGERMLRNWLEGGRKSI